MACLIVLDFFQSACTSIPPFGIQIPLLLIMCACVCTRLCTRINVVLSWGTPATTAVLCGCVSCHSFTNYPLSFYLGVFHCFPTAIVDSKGKPGRSHFLAKLLNICNNKKNYTYCILLICDITICDLIMFLGNPFLTTFLFPFCSGHSCNGTCACCSEGIFTPVQVLPECFHITVLMTLKWHTFYT